MKMGGSECCGVAVQVGDREFMGEGPTPPLAKNNAAVKAIEWLRKTQMQPKKPEDG